MDVVQHVQPRYLFIDEGGDLDFSPTGSKYFTLTSMMASRPFAWDQALADLRYELLEEGIDLERFHATEDKQQVRDRVYALIRQWLPAVRVDSVIVQKAKANPAIRPVEMFYPKILGYLMRYACGGLKVGGDPDLVVITDALPVHAKRKAIEKGVKTTLAKILPSGMRYRIKHHQSKSSFGLQVVDYFNWAIFRAWERRDRRSLEVVKSAVKSQFDIFEKGDRTYYEKK